MNRESLKRHCEETCKRFGRSEVPYTSGTYGEHRLVLELLEQTEWIPISERLPEDIKPVIVTWKNTDPEPYYRHIIGKHFIGVAHYMNGKWFWYSSVTEDMLGAYGRYDSEEFDEAIEVVAWMPLPEPYKAESEE